MTYAEEYTYDLSEIKNGTYAIYSIYSLSIPVDNYEVITICYDDEIHTFKGKVNIHRTDDNPYVDILRKPHVK